MCVCVCACVRACVRACVCVCVFEGGLLLFLLLFYYTLTCTYLVFFLHVGGAAVKLIELLAVIQNKYVIRRDLGPADLDLEQKKRE